MGVPFRQKVAVARYILEKGLRGAKRYPLVLMLEPLFRCNLACAGCGKIDYPEAILNRRLSVAECLAAAEECGAPIVSIAGGEPLIHPDIIPIVDSFIQRRKYIYLCTNGLLLKRRLEEFTPSPYLTFSVHLDGNRERHDAATSRPGVFEQAVEAIRSAIGRGFRVAINCTLFQGESAPEVAGFLDFVTELGVEGVTISPGFSYEHAPHHDGFLQRQASMQLFREIFRLGRGRKWPLNHSSLFLDFLAGNQPYRCTAWGNPTRNVLGWQKPCYLLDTEGHTTTFAALMQETPWDNYGTGRHPQCANCMAHCGYEPTAVCDAVRRPWKAFWVMLRGPRTAGPLAPDPANHTK